MDSQNLTCWSSTEASLNHYWSRWKWFPLAFCSRFGKPLMVITCTESTCVSKFNHISWLLVYISIPKARVMFHRNFGYISNSLVSFSIPAKTYFGVILIRKWLAQVLILHVECTFLQDLSTAWRSWYLNYTR